MKIKSNLLIAFLVLICSCNNKKNDKETIDTKITDKEDSLVSTKQESSNNAYAPIDISPMDMSYYPVDYPKLKMTGAIKTPPVARVIYSRPHLQGRRLFHDLLKYDEAWRLGANESTELQLYQNVSIQGKKIKAGRYVLYCIPQPDKWTIVLNNNIDSWGLQPDSTKDIGRFGILVKQNKSHLEYFTIVFEKIDTGAEMVMAWDDWEARLPIQF
jgi:hypothetical protein